MEGSGLGPEAGVGALSSLVPVAMGVSHHSAPLSIRERFATARLEAETSLSPPHLRDAVVLATCNRFEVYTVAASASEGARRLRAIMDASWDGPREDIGPYLALYVGDDAARHIFRITAGLDSLVIGEAEVLGQVGAALRAASAAGTTRRELGRLFHHAIRVGRRARAETAIGRHSGSIPSVAVHLARRTLGDLTDRRALVVGAGEAATLTVRALVRAGVGEVLVINRTSARAISVAEEVGGRTAPWAALRDALCQTDVVITATGSPEHLLGAEDFQPVTQGPARRRNILVLDIAVPRDVDPAAASVPGVHLFNVDDLRAVRDEGLDRRRGEIGRVEAIIDQELERFRTWWRNAQVAPTVRALHRQAEALRERELVKALHKLPDLDPEELQVVEALTRSLVGKLLHDPIASLKDGLGDPNHVAATRRLFRLPEEEDADAPP